MAERWLSGEHYQTWRQPRPIRQTEEVEKLNWILLLVYYSYTVANTSDLTQRAPDYFTWIMLYLISEDCDLTASPDLFITRVFFNPLFNGNLVCAFNEDENEWYVFSSNFLYCILCFSTHALELSVLALLPSRSNKTRPTRFSVCIHSLQYDYTS